MRTRFSPLRAPPPRAPSDLITPHKMHAKVQAQAFPASQWCGFGVKLAEVRPAASMAGRRRKLCSARHAPARAFCHSSCRVRCSAASLRAPAQQRARGDREPTPPAREPKKDQGTLRRHVPGFCLGGGGQRRVFFFFPSERVSRRPGRTGFSFPLRLSPIYHRHEVSVSVHTSRQSSQRERSTGRRECAGKEGSEESDFFFFFK